MSKTFTDFETEILGSIVSAYADDPSPESGRTYYENDEPDDEEYVGENPYKTALGLKKKKLLRFVEKGSHKGVKWGHFGLTDAGFNAAEELGL